VFRERQGTVEAGISYLESLAGNYARLYPAPAREPCDVRQVIRETIGRLGATGAPELRADLAEDLPLVCTDQLVLRRILENLVGNAVDSLEGRPGTVTISAAAGAPTNGQATVRITVADTGKGMTEPELDHAFDDFYSTKPGGTGLGLSIVRRLVLDANGVLRVETQPGIGSRFIVELPGA
jgi:signal transduction histidine kinase